MKKLLTILVLFPCIFLSICMVGTVKNWITEEHTEYNLYFQKSDSQAKEDYLAFIETGVTNVNDFIGEPFTRNFKVYIHPNRKSLDSTWQSDWGAPDFFSQCWMVASGVSTKLDLLSPGQWAEEACEHVYADHQKTQRLITHELFHVYHGQLNVSPDFSEVYGIDWFLEGFATYASGQCDKERMDDVKQAVISGNIPETLDEFWKGNLRYGLSGSLVMFIDQKYGREKLIELLPFNMRDEILSTLNTTETKLLDEWEVYIKAY